MNKANKFVATHRNITNGIQITWKQQNLSKEDNSNKFEILVLNSLIEPHHL